MKASCLVTAMMMGLGLSVTACSSSTDAELAALDLAAPRYAAEENPNGASTNNHFRPSIYHAHKYELLAAMGYALGTRLCFYGSCSYSSTLSSSIYNTGILSTDEGRELFGAAIECALADGKSMYQSNPSVTYTGKGLMSTTAGWVSAALTNAQKEDVLRCVVARLNANGLDVHIRISGQNVTNQPVDPADTTDWRPDALFDVKIDWPSIGGPHITEYAWPLASVGPNSSSTSCHSVVSAMQARVCDAASSECSFQVLDTATSDCYKYTSTSTGLTYYKCSHAYRTAVRPVVEAWADTRGIAAMYENCLQDVPPLASMDPSYIPCDPLSSP